VKACELCPDPKPGGVPTPAAFVVSYHPVCVDHVVDALRTELSPSADGRRGSTMVPVGFAEQDAA
jgi:hypothetical protein